MKAEWFRRNFTPYYEAQANSRRSGAAFRAANPTPEAYVANVAKQHITDETFRRVGWGLRRIDGHLIWQSDHLAKETSG